MECMNFEGETCPAVEIPASKSVLLRKLLLASLSEEEVEISLSGPLCEDVSAMIGSLNSLFVPIEKRKESLKVFGCGGKFSNPDAELFVGESAACARFLAAAVCFHGKRATFYASGTLLHRPMGILKLLQGAGAKIEYLSENSVFPFRIDAENFSEFNFCTTLQESSQYTSALLLAAAEREYPTTVGLAGKIRESGYLDMTLSCLREFCVPFERTEGKITVLKRIGRAPKRVEAEADLSSASYFCALALLARRKIFLKKVHRSFLQPDDKFLTLLSSRGLLLRECAEGLLCDGENVESFEGFQEDFSLFSDQALTAAALAPFASTPSVLTGLSHLSFQECDRKKAILLNLSRLGVRAEEKDGAVTIFPSKTLRPARIDTFFDHRVAMAFSLVGAKTHVEIANSSCTKKTFEKYCDILKQLKFLDVTFD